MKYVAITGGLGNQMFIYAFCEELRARGLKTALFVLHRANSKKYGHQGYELEKIFNIYPYDGFISAIAVSFLSLYSQILRFFPVKRRADLYKIIGIHIVQVPENFIYYPEVFSFKSKHELFRGTWQSERFFEHAKEKVRNAFVFNTVLISSKTGEIARQMSALTSVSIHIRRGDYLSLKYKDGFGNICTMEYYNRAIEFLKEKLVNPHFYVFTDDIMWVKTNFGLEDATYIEHNTGSDSWQDMYLMSQCKYNIIANSSFSWWGAWLNSNPEKIVIAPKKWWNSFEKDDVVPDNWIRI